MSTREHSEAGTHAVVIGAGIAGLVATRVLTDHFDRVTLLDRDRFPEGPEFRKGVPQARQVHVLLVAGSRIVESLFPGIDEELSIEGGPTLDIGADALVIFPQGQWLRRETGLFVRFCSRGLREWTIRRRLAQHPKVRLIEGAEVTGLLGDGREVTGVRLRARGGMGDGKPPPGTIRADLVIDAGGRDSHNLDWLVELGYTKPPVTVVSSFVSYASRLFRLRPERRDMGVRFIADAPSTPNRPHGAVMAALEGDTWLVSLLGASGHHPPTDDAGFMEWTRRLRTPLVHEALQDAEPLSPIYAYRRTENRFRHFERMARWPERFVVLGDAVVCFNPIYGQGMSVGAQSAMALDARLREHRARTRDLTGFARAFQRRLARFLLGPWVLATGYDLRSPSTEGPRPGRAVELAQRYADQVLYLVTEDEAVHRAFVEVQHGIRPAQALFHPAIAAKVLQRLWRRRAAPPAAEPANTVAPVA